MVFIAYILILVSDVLVHYTNMFITLTQFSFGMNYMMKNLAVS